MAPTKSDLESAPGPFHLIPLTTLPPPAYPGTYTRDPSYTLPSSAQFNTYTPPSAPTKKERKCGCGLPSIRKVIYITILIFIVFEICAAGVKHVLDKKNGESAGVAGPSATQVVKAAQVSEEEGAIRMSILPFVVASSTAESGAVSVATGVSA